MGGVYPGVGTCAQSYSDTARPWALLMRIYGTPISLSRVSLKSQHSTLHDKEKEPTSTSTLASLTASLEADSSLTIASMPLRGDRKTHSTPSSKETMLTQFRLPVFGVCDLSQVQGRPRGLGTWKEGH